jgi:hypothetical protein
MSYFMLRAVGIFLVLFAASCKNSSSKNEIEKLYHKLLVVSSEGLQTNEVTCRATFHKDGETGTEIALSSEYSIYIDNKKLSLLTDNDLAPEYRLLLKNDSLIGNHKWKIKYKDLVISETDFSFTTFKITNQLDSVMGDKDVTLQITGLKNGDKIECWFDNEDDVDFEEEDFTYTVLDNSVTIPMTDIRKHKSGKYSLLINSIQKTPVVINGRKVGISEVIYEYADILVTIKHDK